MERTLLFNLSNKTEQVTLPRRLAFHNTRTSCQKDGSPLGWRYLASPTNFTSSRPTTLVASQRGSFLSLFSDILKKTRERDCFAILGHRCHFSRYAHTIPKASDYPGMVRQAVLPHDHLIRDEKLIDDVITALDMWPSDTVLVIGAGNGNIPIEIAKCGNRVITVDSNEARIVNLKNRLSDLHHLRVEVHLLDVLRQAIPPANVVCAVDVPIGVSSSRSCHTMTLQMLCRTPFRSCFASLQAEKKRSRQGPTLGDKTFE
eukprot:GHVN01105264.1.p1 GENE.GHVN01105264.1~~GHVN01105264.1.p1  ORF type:complete len:259 (+),score=13.77 GHVN01105264.1:750-1526(+)